MTTTCIHQWQIEPAQGPTSLGVCQRCGAARQFSNTVDDPENWTQDAAKRHRARYGRGRKGDIRDDTDTE